MTRPWVLYLAWCSLGVGFICAGWIVYDVYGRGRRQRMAVMEAVWPLTALYFGPLAMWAYYRIGRASAAGSSTSRRPHWAGTALSVTHCGAGCVLGDVIAEFALFGIGASIAGETLYAEYAGDYVVAIAFGVLFQYFVITRMRRVSLRRGLAAAAMSDVVALTAFEVGLFFWMALMRFVFFSPPLHPSSPVYWLFMQLGMILGFATSWPANTWLIRRGIKEAM